MNQHTKPRSNVPADATDCHIHVFGELHRYPPAAKRSYTPLPASLDDYLAMTATVGLRRNVFVQASAYGTDNRCMLDAMRSRGRDGFCDAGGVRVADEDGEAHGYRCEKDACVRDGFDDIGP